MTYVVEIDAFFAAFLPGLKVRGVGALVEAISQIGEGGELLHMFVAALLSGCRPVCYLIMLRYVKYNILPNIPASFFELFLEHAKRPSLRYHSTYV